MYHNDAEGGCSGVGNGFLYRGTGYLISFLRVLAVALPAARLTIRFPTLGGYRR